ncbi:MAG TPA: hypothetical protein VFO19_02390 [Vicinamibacterales bacterium]|nr:hypothetical protein [Vicinamibacterales bacterium]
MSAHAAEIDRVMWLVHGLMFVLFAGWGMYFTWVLLRFRRRRQPAASHGGAKGRLAFWVEVGVVAAEAVLLVVFALPVWFRQTTAQPAERGALEIRVVAEQFLWNVHYPGADGQFGATSAALIAAENPLGLDRQSPAGRDDIVMPGQMHLPVNRPVVIHLSSKDVIHSFGVPAMRVKQDAIPGTLSRVSFTPIATGEFDIACSQLCGLGHYRMRGVITVESEEAFQRFLATEATAQTRR